MRRKTVRSRGVPIFSAEATRLIARGPRWRDPPEPPYDDDQGEPMSIADDMQADYERYYARKRRVEDVARAIAALEPGDLPVREVELLDAAAWVRRACEDEAARIVAVWD